MQKSHFSKAYNPTKPSFKAKKVLYRFQERFAGCDDFLYIITQCIMYLSWMNGQPKSPFSSSDQAKIGQIHGEFTKHPFQDLKPFCKWRFQSTQALTAGAGPLISCRWAGRKFSDVKDARSPIIGPSQKHIPIHRVEMAWVDLHTR